MNQNILHIYFTLDWPLVSDQHTWVLLDLYLCTVCLLQPKMAIYYCYWPDAGHCSASSPLHKLPLALHKLPLAPDRLRWRCTFSHQCQIHKTLVTSFLDLHSWVKSRQLLWYWSHTFISFPMYSTLSLCHFCHFVIECSPHYCSHVAPKPKRGWEQQDWKLLWYTLKLNFYVISNPEDFCHFVIPHCLWQRKLKTKTPVGGCRIGIGIRWV